MTTPTGKLAWGQSGNYDAIDDRAVIAAVTRNRTGLVWPVAARAGSGLQIIITGGWLGVAGCGDSTSAVVGTGLDTVVTANPGPASGNRWDLIWCDTEPDESRWSLVVIPESQAEGRSGIPLVRLNVPANATTAAEMGIDPQDAVLERRLLGSHSRYANDLVVSATTWGSAGTAVWCDNMRQEPGQWYRIRLTANSIQHISGPNHEGRIGIGQRPAGAPDSSAALMRASTISFGGTGFVTHAEVEYLYRVPKDAVRSQHNFNGRFWGNGTSSYRLQAYVLDGPGLVFSVEDVGS